MRIANVQGRATLLTDGAAFDVERASGGRFEAAPEAVFDRWDEFAGWAAEAGQNKQGRLEQPVDPAKLEAPSPRPRQVFAIGLNYLEHAQEAGIDEPGRPSVFTKYLGSLSGPAGDLALPSDNVDWEAELVAVIGKRADKVAEEVAWQYVAGLTVGQDFSERAIQSTGAFPQFSLGKSFAGFGPTGPWLVTPDELADRDDLAIECTVNGVSVQKSRTSKMIYSIAGLVAYLSKVTPLLPGDLIFTGTPSGVGWAREPRWTLRAGDEVVTTIEGIGELKQKCVVR